MRDGWEIKKEKKKPNEIEKLKGQNKNIGRE